MINRRTRILLGVIFMWVTVGSGVVSALIIGGTTEPMRDRGLPAGAVELANLKTRVAWWEGPPFGGGEYHFEYRGDTTAFNEALKAFAAVNAPGLEVVLHGGTSESFWLKTMRAPNVDCRIDWIFTVWIPSHWHSLYNTPGSYFTSDQPNFRRPVAPPRIDVYLGGSIDWKSVSVPKGIHITDTRASTAGFPFDGNAVLVGTVYDIATAKPIAGAHVIVNRPDAKGESRLADAKSDAQGRFQIEKISPGICTVDVSADGYAARRAAYEHLGPDTLKRLTVELAMATDVEGTVIDADEGKPVAAVEVRLDSPMAIDGRGYRSPAQPRAITDAAGRFKIVGVPAGYAQLWCVASGYYHNSLAKLYKFPGEAVKLELVGTGTVKIQVFDAKRQPIKENYIVEIEPEGGGGVGTWGGSSQVGPDGTVTFDGVPPGKYRISGRPNPGSVNDNSPNYWIKVVRRKTVNVEVVHGKY